MGMLCSTTEIGLEKLDDGILVLDSSIKGLKIGAELNSLGHIADSVFEVDITPNRGDCQSIYGIARELASAFSWDDFLVSTEETCFISSILSISSKK